MSAPADQYREQFRRPSRLLLLMEGRALADAFGMVPMFVLRRHLPQGDGHPVLVLPGFLASSKSTVPLRRLLGELGYAAHRWKLGYNTGYSRELHDGMRARVLELHQRYQRRVSLVGWSLGGVFVRELARETPEAVRLVITMGSPFRGNPRASNVQKLYEMFSDTQYDEMPADFLTQLATPPPVPTTALYTKGDGVVAWQSTTEKSPRTDVENIHVGGAHMGLGFNPRAVVAIADRLAQTEGRWRPFQPNWYLKWFYRNYYPDWLVGRGKQD